MNSTTKFLTGGIAAGALVLGIAGGALAQSDEEPVADPVADEVPDDDANEQDQIVSDPAAEDQARQAALAEVDGTITEVELADEGDSGYEVEVKRPDGSFVEIALDEGFEVISVEEDDD